MRAASQDARPRPRHPLTTHSCGSHDPRRGCTAHTRMGSCVTRLPGGDRGAAPVRKRGPVTMQHEGLRRRARGSAHCHVRRRLAQGCAHLWTNQEPCGRASQPIRSGSHSRRRGGRGKSLQSEVQKEKVRLRQPIRGWGAYRARERARTLANTRQELEGLQFLFFLFFSPWPNLEWVSSRCTTRAGLSAPRPIIVFRRAPARGGGRARRGGGVGASLAQDL